MCFFLKVNSKTSYNMISDKQNLSFLVAGRMPRTVNPNRVQYRHAVGTWLAPVPTTIICQDKYETLINYIVS